jgi:ribosome biogenesis GTPase
MNQPPARVILSATDHCLINDGDSAVHRCRPRSRHAPKPVCGDWVDWTAEAGGGWIDDIRARRNLIERGDFRGRPRGLAANVDRLVLVVAPVPRPDDLLVDRYIVLSQALDIPLMLWCHKSDRPPDDNRDQLIAVQRRCTAMGVSIMAGSIRDAASLERLAARTMGATVILVGQSGVGKSSLTQALVPGASLRTGAISASSGQGRHTTSQTTLFERPDGGALIDSPGVRTLRLDHLQPDAVDAAYPAIAEAARRCRFNDCRHLTEPDCGIREAIAQGRFSSGTLERWQRLRQETGG